MNQPPTGADRRRSQLLAEIGQLGFCLPGSLSERYTRCSSTGCRCHAQPPQLHGPYHSWTRKIAGRTSTRVLSAEQAERYKPWFENARRLRALIAALEALSLEIAEAAEGWGKNRRADLRKASCRAG